MAVSYFVRMRAVEGKEQMVQEVLLSNVQRIRAGERGNLAFAVHRSRQDSREFGLYETWVDLAVVEEHESGADFKAYKEQLRPLVESGSVLFGDAEPLAVLGYPFPGGGEAR